jgi:hypothetical protein
MPVSAVHGDAQAVGGLLEGQAGEDAQIDDLRLERVAGYLPR